VAGVLTDHFFRYNEIIGIIFKLLFKAIDFLFNKKCPGERHRSNKRFSLTIPGEIFESMCIEHALPPINLFKK